MSKSLSTPFFPTPPSAYEPRYFAEVTRAFALFADQVRTPGPERATTITITNLQSGSDIGLALGTVFEVDGFLKITRINNPHVAGVSAEGEAGSVAVVIT